MVTSPFSLSVKRSDVPWELQKLPPEWRITEYVGVSEYGPDDILTRSNYRAIMESLRGLTKDGEGPVEGNATGYPDYGFEPENADWFEYGGRIAWKCRISPEEFKRAKKDGSYIDRRSESWGYDASEAGYQLLAIDLLGTSSFEHTEPVLDCLLEINHDLDHYPVLDEEDFDKREYKAECEQIQSSKPDGCPDLTESQLGRVRLFLSQYSWPADDPNEQGCAADYQVEWSGEDCHVNDNSKSLDDCVKYALRKLRIWPHYRTRHRRG